MISELRFENFRGFTSLMLKDLKRVNLIVGENNSGKTSLLEGILLLCDASRVGQLPGLFRAHQGNPDARYFRWLLRDGAEDGRGELAAKASKEEPSRPPLPLPVELGQLAAEAGIEEWRRYLEGPNADEGAMIILKQVPVFYECAALRLRSGDPQIKRACRIISDQHRDPKALATLVGKVQRKGGGEETLQRLLAIVDPRIRKVRVDPGEDGNQVIVDIGLSELIPVSQAGQGVYRLVTILADIIGETPDVVLVDEFENGLHYSLLGEVWHGVRLLAEQENVQVFATTHSYECIRAAHQEFAATPDYDFALHRLDKEKGEIVVRTYDRETLETSLVANFETR
jgi:predicted ATPase